MTCQLVRLMEDVERWWEMARLCHGVGVTRGASKTGDTGTGAVTKFGHRTEPCTLTAVSRVPMGISTYSFHPVEPN